jgi:hypothetical protein
MSHDPFVSAVQELEKQRDLLVRQLKAVDQILENMKQAQQAADSLPNVLPTRPEEFKGMKVANALAVYLRARRGQKIPLPIIIEGLLAGGISPGKPRGKRTQPEALIAQTIKIALPNNRHLFEWEPDQSLQGVPEDKIFIGLAPTADQIKHKPPRPQSKSRSKNS